MSPQGIRKITVQFLILAVLASSVAFGFAAFGNQAGSAGARDSSQTSTTPIGQNAFVADPYSGGGLLANSDISGSPNLTATLAANLALQITKNNPNGPTTDGNGQLGFNVPENIDTVLAQAMAGAPPSLDAIFPQVAIGNIKVQNSYTSADIARYLIALGPLVQAQSDSDYLAALSVNASSSPEAVNAVESSIAQLKNSLMVATVPQPFLKFHTSLLNLLDTQDKIVGLTTSDPMRALLLLNQGKALMLRENNQIALEAANVVNNLPNIKAAMKTAGATPSFNEKLAEFFDLRVNTAHAQVAGLVGSKSSALLACAKSVWATIGGWIDTVAGFFGLNTNFGGGPQGVVNSTVDNAKLIGVIALDREQALTSVPVWTGGSNPFTFENLIAVKMDQATNASNGVVQEQKFCNDLLDWLEKVGTHLLINDLINRMQKAIVAWATGGDPLKAAITYGANSGPKFVTNWKQFAEIAFNDAAGAVLQNIEPRLCSPLAPYLKIVLKPIQNGQSQYPACTLDSILNNLKTSYTEFASNFLAGGMVTYARVLEPQNNIWGTFIMASDEQLKAATAAEAAAILEVQAGSGYTGTRACVSTHVVPYGNKSVYVNDPNTVEISGCGADGFCTHIVVCNSLDDWRITTTPHAIGAIVEASLVSTITRIINAQDLQGLFDFAISSVLTKLIGSGDKGLTRGNLSSAAPGTINDLCGNFSTDSPEYAACARQVDSTNVYCQQYPEGSEAYNNCIATYQSLLNGTSTQTQAGQPMDLVTPPGDASYATDPLSFSKSGVFFKAGTATSSPGNTRMQFSLPVEAGKNYHSLTADFDMHMGDFAGGAFNGTIVDLGRTAVQTNPARRGFMAAWITLLNSDTKGIRTVIDTLDNRVQAVSSDWTANTNYHIHLVYDTAAARVTMDIKDTDRGQNLASATSPVSNTDLRDQGDGLAIGFGLEAPVDGGAYVPPYGWSFSNLQVTVTP